MKVKGVRKKDIWDANVEVRPEDVAGVERRNLADAIFKAVVKCAFHRVRFMLENGVSPKVINDDGQNLLVASLYIQDDAKRDRMFQLLVRKGADVCHVDENTGRDVLGWAAYLGRSDQVQFILEAVMGEVDLLRRDFEGMTPLHHCVIGGHVKVVEILVQNMVRYGLNVDTADIHGLTPYIYARRLARYDIAAVLLEKGGCSRQQLDSVTFRSAEEWERIGRKEKLRKEREQIQKERHMSKFNRLHKRVKLVPIKPKELPKVAVSFVTPEEIKHPRVDECRSPTRNSSASVDIALHEEQVATERRLSPLQIPALALTTPGRYNFVNTSIDTAASLIALSAPKRRPNSREIEQMLIESARTERDKSRRPICDNLNDFLDLAAAQSSDSFRIPVRPPTPPEVRERKIGMSTLAVVLGKKSKQDGPSQRKSVASMSTMLTTTNKFMENITEKKRRKPLNFPSVA